MTRFEKDLKRAKEGDEISVLKERKSELVRLCREKTKCKNSFRALCICQEINKLSEEYKKISALF